MNIRYEEKEILNIFKNLLEEKACISGIDFNIHKKDLTNNDNFPFSNKKPHNDGDESSNSHQFHRERIKFEFGTELDKLLTSKEYNTWFEHILNIFGKVHSHSFLHSEDFCQNFCSYLKNTGVPSFLKGKGNTPVEKTVAEKAKEAIKNLQNKKSSRDDNGWNRNLDSIKSFKSEKSEPFNGIGPDKNFKTPKVEKLKLEDKSVVFNQENIETEYSELMRKFKEMLSEKKDTTEIEKKIASLERELGL